MNQELINKILHRATDEAGRADIAITVSVVDTGGHLVAMLRQENCSYFAIDASRKKAITSSQLKLPSHLLNDVGKQFPELQRSLDKNTEIELLPGGFPVRVNGTIIGGIGIAGGNFQQDKSIGEYASNIE